jgi:chromosome partitioning protein
MPHPENPLLDPAKLPSFQVALADKHPGSICVANYKGGVGKTTLVCLLGYYLIKSYHKTVLLIDIDPQCSLSLAMGFDPVEVSGSSLTIYDLMKPSKWTKIRKTNFHTYVIPVPDSSIPPGLSIIRGSFKTDDLDMEIATSIAEHGSTRIDQLFLYTKQMLNGFDKFDVIIVDCPPNKMFLTQAMLRACSFYLPVTIPDVISIYGMPRLLRWIREIPKGEKPPMLGYVLNAVNRAGGLAGGKVYSQQAAQAQLEAAVPMHLDAQEKQTIGDQPLLGVLPRLDVIARFLGESGGKFYSADLAKKTSGQPSVEKCMTDIAEAILGRMERYHAQA